MTEGLRQPVDDGFAQRRVENGLVQCGPQMVDRGRRFGEQGGAAKFEQHIGPLLQRGWLAQCPGEAAPGGLRSACPQVLAGGFAELPHGPGVALGVHLQQVPGSRGCAQARARDNSGGLAVHGHAERRGNRPVDGGGDQRVEKLQPVVVRGVGSRVGEDAGLAQPGDGVG